MAMGLRILVALQCIVCRATAIPDDEPGKQEVRLVGADKYASCIACDRKITKITQAYKKRWDKYSNEYPNP